MKLNKLVHTVDAHAEGEPSRIVVGGVIDVPGETMFDKKMYLENYNDEFRKFLIHEPRGSTVLHADLVLPPTNSMADAGFIIMEATDYPPMSGSNTICTVTVLLETGMLPMVEPITEITLESPAGLINVEAHCKNGKCERVTFTNAPSFVTHLDEKITVPRLGEVKVDVAYGGAFFVFVDAESLGYKIIDEEAGELSQLGEEIKRAAASQLPIAHPENEDIHTISFTTFTAPPLVGGQGRNATIVSPGRVDRSACGTATSARLAILHAKNELGIEHEYVHESILNTNFVGEILEETEVGPYPGVITSISGRAWITGTHQLSVDPSDPFTTGITLPDLWERF
ncbi:proline racemase family protein [Natribacillus halophilus]|uniref:Proline racemase n=1 Tax=Natribacillus halophilus TaxID=549003 RepID=A0A1G8R7I6_9BACI|nr:proline racemase family protein [Natribacillus halophilus]SDJ12919.1 proline racemase [Natribacillus halophilus]